MLSPPGTHPCEQPGCAAVVSEALYHWRKATGGAALCPAHRLAAVPARAPLPGLTPAAGCEARGCARAVTREYEGKSRAAFGRAYCRRCYEKRLAEGEPGPVPPQAALLIGELTNP